MSLSDEEWMRHALDLAVKAGKCNEVPVGAIVVHEGLVVGRGFNQPISTHDPTAHAEIQALRDAAKTLGNYRLVGCTLYVTIEPCAMCAGAIVHSRVARLVYGATEPKAGAIQSQTRQLDGEHLNHRVEYIGGVCAELCSRLVSDFFVRRRQEKANKVSK